MLFSHSSLWKLNCYKRKVDKSLQLISGKCMAEYCLLALSLTIIEGFRANKAYMGNPTLQNYIQRANFGTKTLSYILLLSNFLFQICTSIHQTAEFWISRVDSTQHRLRTRGRTWIMRRTRALVPNLKFAQETMRWENTSPCPMIIFFNLF